MSAQLVSRRLLPGVAATAVLLLLTATSLRAGVPGAVDSSEEPPSESVRTWTDASGKFQIEAVLQGVEAGKARLRKPTGQEISVPVERLSLADQQYAALPADEELVGVSVLLTAPQGEGSFLTLHRVPPAVLSRPRHLSRQELRGSRRALPRQAGNCRTWASGDQTAIVQLGTDRNRGG